MTFPGVQDRPAAVRRPSVTREEYAEALLPLVMRLVGAVREEGPGTIRAVLNAVRATPAPDGGDPMEALAVVLAAAVDPEKPVSELLGWVDTLKAPGPADRDVTAEGVRAVMVGLAIDGLVKAVSLTEEECREAAALLMEQERWGPSRIAQHLECDKALIERWTNREYRRRQRRRAAEQNSASAA
jgi:hypothetical protein